MLCYIMASLHYIMMSLHKDIMMLLHYEVMTTLHDDITLCNYGMLMYLNCVMMSLY